MKYQVLFRQRIHKKNIKPYFLRKKTIKKYSRLSFAAVVIGALRINVVVFLFSETFTDLI